MSILRRMSDVVQQKLNRAMDKAEDPAEAMDFAYQKQLEQLQQVRRSIADVLTSEKRLELQAAQLQQSTTKLQGQAQQALQQGREDLARLALTRAETAKQQLSGLQVQVEQMKEQEQKLELVAQKLQAKVEAFRTQKETIKAQYSAAQAQTKIGEAVTGLSEQMNDVNMMVERAQDKTNQMQARAAAIDQLVDSGVLDQIGAGSGDDIDRQLMSATTASNVDAQMAALKAQLGGPSAPAGQLTEGTKIVRIQGEDQYRISQADRDVLDDFDRRIVASIDAGDETGLKTTVGACLAFVRARGQKLANTELVGSDLVLPHEDMSLDEAKKIMTGPAPA